MRNVYLYFIGISLVVFGCKERQLNTNVLSAIDTIVYHKPVDTLCSQYVSKITYLQLKNSDNHMLHDVTKIKSSKDKIYHIPIFCIGKVLNNIKLETLNPSNSHNIYK